MGREKFKTSVNVAVCRLLGNMVYISYDVDVVVWLYLIIFVFLTVCHLLWSSYIINLVVDSKYKRRSSSKSANFLSSLLTFKRKHKNALFTKEEIMVWKETALLSITLLSFQKQKLKVNRNSYEHLDHGENLNEVCSNREMYR